MFRSSGLIIQFIQCHDFLNPMLSRLITAWAKLNLQSHLWAPLLRVLPFPWRALFTPQHWPWTSPGSHRSATLSQSDRRRTSRMLGAWGGRGALWKGKRSHREWSLAVLKPWRAPYGVALRSACRVLLVGGEPWSVWKWRRWLLFSAGGLAAVGATGEKGGPPTKTGLEIEGKCDATAPCPASELGHGNVSGGRQPGPWDGGRQRGRWMFGSSSFSPSAPAPLVRPPPQPFLGL